MAQDPSILDLYHSFDNSDGFRMLPFLLCHIEEGKQNEFIQVLVATIYQSYSPHPGLEINQERRFIMAFNQRELNEQVLRDLFG